MHPPKKTTPPAPLALSSQRAVTCGRKGRLSELEANCSFFERLPLGLGLRGGRRSGERTKKNGWRNLDRLPLSPFLRLRSRDSSKKFSFSFSFSSRLLSRPQLARARGRREGGGGGGRAPPFIRHRRQGGGQAGEEKIAQQVLLLLF